MTDRPPSVRTDAELASALRISMTRLVRRMRSADTSNEGDEQAAPALSVSNLAVLALLGRHGDLSVGQLAHAERVRPPSMTRTITCLEELGLVERCAHPTDRRQVLVATTEAGQKALSAERRRRDVWLRTRLATLTTTERALLRRAAPLLERLSTE